MELLGRYRNGNYVTTILSDGTRIRETNDDEFIPDHAENMDIKITNCCSMSCPFCHEGSTKDGKHGDILNEKFIETLHEYQEVACLSGDTYVFGDSGAKRIDELSIGDSIYDSDHILRKIISIQKSNKPVYKLSGNRGISIKCSNDHPFMSNGILKNAEDMVNEKIDRLSKKEQNKQFEIPVVDMGRHIRKSNEDNVHSVGGKIFDNNTVRISNCCNPIPRYINLNKELMYLYGWYVAEGSSKSLVMNINELDIAESLGKIWNKYFYNDYRIFKNEDANSLALELYPQSVLDSFCVKALKAGVGARNKSIGFLFSLNDTELIRSALLGLFDGDGCYRTRNNKNNKYYAATLKTSSKKLAYEVCYILAKHFGIYSSIFHGINKRRKIEDRILEPTDYYSVEIYGAENLSMLFPERFGELDMIQKQSLRLDKINKIEKVEDEVLYDITLDSGSHIFPINGFVLTHNCGGGNILEHPDLIPFLEKLKEKKVIANITVNQIHFEKEQELIKKLVDEKLIYGLGVSLVKSTDKFINLMKQYPNAVVHTINGVLTEFDVKAMENNNLKMLILGYKHLRRGNEYFEHERERIEANQNWLYKNLDNITCKFKVVSFDNLAIEQLNVKRLMSDKEWDEFYQGDDGSSTYYIDMVERKFARSSTAPFDKRYDLLDSVDDMFEVIRNENN
nr:MAG TPA: DNA-directed RNA polymerase subunit A'' [Caudoviricetes sp.]